MEYVATFRPIPQSLGGARQGYGMQYRRRFEAESPLAAEVRAQHIARERSLFLVGVAPLILDPDCDC